ncbi:MAG TPA: type III-A CRISPR-associated protein Cas10/Csm1 [Nitrospirae bacterium]|nr:hypothetical protein BMS3Abin06_01566 [bacterium BMS3Abin06]HDH12657.1 type III-A CRISPR-associated protein Cas10/Csm1 [Nitrospirota bacterium]HDY99965.1 type III-A CRISPR-associated protein Cas10/Csm1 [Nitrospirota bacterium]
MGEFNQKEYQTVILGALLHDVGKLLQKGTFPGLRTEGKHPQVSANFISAFDDFFTSYTDIELLKTLVQRHHEYSGMGDDLTCKNAPQIYRAFSYLVSRADNYSSSERGGKSKEYQDYKLTPLVSVFSRVRLDKESSEKLKYRLKELMPEKAFPEKFDIYNHYEYNSHLQGFGAEFEELVKRSRSSDYDSRFTNILNILLKYAWCIPSNTQEDVPDVSLYDHLKTTAAIAACSYLYHHPVFSEKEIKDDTTEKFVLLVGDLSGIQNYIFNITHVGAGGVAKRLRARSFQLNMFSEIISHKILHEFNLPITNILMASGGKFYILLPGIQGTEAKLNSIRQEVDQWFYKHMNAEININLASMALSGKDFEDYGKKVAEINHLLQKTKKMPFHSIMSKNQVWNEDVATLNVDFAEEEKLCKACERFPCEFREEQGAHFCDRCSDDAEIGRKLPRADQVSFYNNGKGMFNGPCGYSFDFKTNGNDAYMAMSIGKDEPVYNSPYSLKYTANHIPVFPDDTYCNDCAKRDGCKNEEQADKNLPMFFNCLAVESTGRPMLGYLKADVDNLGGIFGFGLKQKDEEEKNFASVSRIATLSRMLDVFFSGYIQILMENNYPELYTVYSGGDDLLVIGAWDSIIRFSDEMQKEFKRFVCNNKNLTLSSGIALVKHNYPVFRAVEMAEQALEKSKSQEGKDSVTVFDHTVKWSQFPAILNEAEKFGKWLKEKDISMGFARNLLHYSEMNRMFKETGQTEYLKFLPLMTYDIARNISAQKHEVRKWAEELKEPESRTFKNMGIILNYALSANRGG